MSSKYLEKASKRHCWSRQTMAEAYEAGFHQGAREQLYFLQEEILYWLDVTGVLGEGTSYYSELVDGILGCPISKAQRCRMIANAGDRLENEA